MAYDILEAISYAQFVSVAYTITSGDNPQYQLTPAQIAAGFTVLTPIFANDLATDFKAANAVPVLIVPYGFVAKSGNTFVVAIRGTEGIFEWIQDAKFLMENNPVQNGQGQTEDGFSDVYSSMKVGTGATLIQYLQQNLGAGSNLVVCGHSLGAALATLAAYDAGLNVKGIGLTLYTYASPNVGDSTFANSFNATVPVSWRIVNPLDIVTHVPTELFLGYKIVGTTIEYWPVGIVSPSIPCFHVLPSYLAMMSVAAGQNPPLQPDADCKP